MSSFSGLNTALTGLHAQRTAIEVASQNISNVNTPGYTRQRANLEAIDGTVAPSMYSTPRLGTGGGVMVSSVERLTDVFLEARVRNELGTTGYLNAVANIHSLLESGLNEPSEQGVAAALDTFFTSWADVSNRPDDAAAGAVLLENAASLVTAIRSGYEAATTEWQSTHSKAKAAVVEVNTTADAVADLNDRIRAITASGGNANALIDERNQHVNALAELVGGEARVRDDGTVDVMLGGNALVRGDKAYHVALTGANTHSALEADGAPTLAWAADPEQRAGAVVGEVSGLVATLAEDGVIANLAKAYNTLASDVAGKVNEIHAGGFAADGIQRDFFSGTDAMSLGVVVDDTAQLAVRNSDGTLNGGFADKIAQLAGEVGGQWSSVVVSVGVEANTAIRRASNAEGALSTAEGLLMSQTGVNLDEETINLLSYQRAYEAAARVMTTVDEMLDVLINRTGVVGR